MTLQQNEIIIISIKYHISKITFSFILNLKLLLKYLETNKNEDMYANFKYNCL